MTDQKDGPQFVVTVKDLRLSRRSLLRGMAIGGAGLATAGFAACGDDDDDAGATTTTAGGETTTTAGGDTTAPSGEVETVSFVYGFPSPHAGILYTHYNAMAQGFWEEEGLDVQIEYQTAGIQLLAGETVDYGEVSADEILNAYSAGQRVKAFYQPTYGQQFGFVVPVDSPITEWSAEQLDGKTIGITELAGGEVPIARAALARIGLEEGNQVQFFPTSGASQAITVDAFNTDRIQVFAGSILDHAAVQVAGLELRAITPDFILNAAGDNALGVRADFLEENRDQIVRLGRGMAKSKAWAFNPDNRDAAVDAALAIAPETGPREEVAGFIDLLHINRALPPDVAGIEEGEIWIQGWDDYQNLLLEGGTGGPDDPLTFTEPIPVEEIVDNSLIPDIWDFDRDEISTRPPK